MRIFKKNIDFFIEVKFRQTHLSVRTYTKNTLPVLNHYINQKLLYEINGMIDIPSIYKEIRRIIYSLEA